MAPDLEKRRRHTLISKLPNHRHESNDVRPGDGALNGMTDDQGENVPPRQPESTHCRNEKERFQVNVGLEGGSGKFGEDRRVTFEIFDCPQ